MNTLQRLGLAMAAILVVSTIAPAQKMMRSATNGNWGSAATWEVSTDGGSTRAAAVSAPAAVDSLTVKNSAGVTVDGLLNEADWASAPTIAYGLGAFDKKGPSDLTVTGAIDVKNPFTDASVEYYVPHTDSTLTNVKIMRRGLKLYIGISSDDKSICKFDWEGDGVFLKIKNSVGQDREYKLYWQNIDANKDTMRYEEQVVGSGFGWGVLHSGSTVNDTANVDSGYTAELMIDLEKLGYTYPVSSVEMTLVVFDPDGFQHPMNAWDHTIGSFYKSWWGSEWGGVYGTLNFTTEPFEDVASLTVKNSMEVTVDGQLTEGDWATAPTLAYGLGAFLKKDADEFSVTGAVDVKNPFTDASVQYAVPHTDSTLTKVTFMRKGLKLYIGLDSDDKSICKFDWEGDGLFVKIKNSVGQDREYKLYWQNIDANKDTMRYEEQVAGSGMGWGYLKTGSTVNDTTNVDAGYSAELMIDLAKLGYTLPLSSVELTVVVFDPDGFQHPMSSWDHTIGSFYKSWWGSEWGGVYRTLNFEIEPYDDPASLTVKNSMGVTVDGQLNEADWTGAPTLVYGAGAFTKKAMDEFTVTAAVDVKNPFTDASVQYSVPHKDSTLTKVKVMRKGMNLYIGIDSDDKSICKFDWEGDGLFVKIKNSVGQDREYKLYWQNIDANKDTMRYEEQVAGSGMGWGYLKTGSTVNDTTYVDAGYSAELMIDLSKLGYTAPLASVQLTIVVFDPDGFQHPMSSWDHTIGSFYKSWWGSEWGGVYRSLEFTVEPFDDPDSLIVSTSGAPLTLDGQMLEPDWTGAQTLVYGLGSHLKKSAGEFTVTTGVDVKNPFTDASVQYSVPHTDSTLTKVKFLVRGASLYIGFDSDDKSICKFDWEGDGVFVKIKNSVGQDREYKLYWQNIEANKDTMRYEEQVVGSGAGWGHLKSGSTVNDTTNVDAGYSAELRIDLDKLGYAPGSHSVQLTAVIFDPDGFQHPMNAWDHSIGSFYKSWWGSEWGGVYRTLTMSITTGVGQDGSTIPDVYALAQNYPNPFNPSTTFSFDLPVQSNVVLKVYDMLGRDVATVTEGILQAGSYSLPFNAGHLSSGVYVYRITADDATGNGIRFTAVKRFTLIK